MTTPSFSAEPAPVRIAKLQKALDQYAESEANNVSAYDKALLTLSSAALGLSLAFSKDLAPPATAKHLGLLFLSWAFFGGTLFVNIVGFLRALTDVRQNRLDAAACFRDLQMSETAFGELVNGRDARIYRLNVTQGILFIIGTLLLAFYIGINIASEAKMGDKDTVVIVKKAHSGGNVVVIPYQPQGQSSGQSQQSQGQVPQAQNQTPTPTVPTKGSEK